MALEGSLEIKLPSDFRFEQSHEADERWKDLEEWLRKLSRSIEDYSRGAYFDSENIDSDVLRKSNTAVFSPSNAYEPATKKYVDDSIPTGLIAMWYDSIVSIPTGWALCNGSGGTIDLRDKFVVCAGTTYAVAGTGGTTTHTHTGSSHTHTTAAHDHSYSGSTDSTGGLNMYAVGSSDVPRAHSHTYSGTTSSVSAGNTGAEGTGNTSSSGTLPPYYALAFIQKIV